MLHEQIRHERGPDGRYRRCEEVPGGHPDGQKEEVELVDEHVAGLTQNRKDARLLGTELDAALQDPRWRAVDTERPVRRPMNGATLL